MSGWSLLGRAAAASSVLMITFASFAGCTQGAPAARPSGPCEPAEATISWGSGEVAGDGLYGIYTLTYDYQRGRWGSVFEELPSQPGFEVPEHNGLFDVNPAVEAQWQKALVKDARRTGQVGPDFGSTRTGLTPTTSKARPAAPSHSTFVVGMRTAEFALPFTVTCPSGLTVHGQVIAPNGTGWHEDLRECGDAQPSGSADVALDYCPGARG